MGYNLEKKMFALLIVAASVLSVSAQPFSLTFTGDVEVDFPESQNAQNKDFASGKYEIQTVADAFDVGVPPGISQSGWDIKDMRFQYDYANDALHIGLNCFGVCGDADGDGDEGRSGAVLTDNGGVDLPNFLNSETCAVAIDVGTAGTNMPDGQFDFALGYPAENNGDNVFPCGNQFGSDCFGLYRFNNADASQTMVAQIGKLFLWDPNDATLTQARANGWAINHTPLTTAQKPDLEWTLNDYNMILASDNIPPVDSTGVQEFEISLATFCGSFQDDGVGEDSFPNAGRATTIRFPCQVFDACDVCAGNGQTCLDCAGTPFGQAQYDVCDVCNGNGRSCLDCQGTPFGLAQYDVCNVCGGDGTTCRDCAGVPFGTSAYDACDVCNGDGQGCRDCRGVVAGTTTYDVCNVCGGDGTSCLDCANTPFGNANYDRCDVCRPANDPARDSTCLDCARVPNGPRVYDACDVCGGDGTSCLDCQGVVFGTSRYDQCDVCDGDGQSCVPVPKPLDLCARRNFDRCELFPGDSFDGVYPDDSGENLAGKKYTATVAQDGYVIFASEYSTTWSRLVPSDDRTELSVQDVLAVPDAHSCQKEDGGLGFYTVSWSHDCLVLQLDRKTDSCSYRRSLWGNKVSLLKKPCRGPADGICSIQERTVWTGKDDEGARSWFVFGGNDAYVETHITATGERTSFFGRIALNDKRQKGYSASSSSSSSSSSWSSSSSSSSSTSSTSLSSLSSSNSTTSTSSSSSSSSSTSTSSLWENRKRDISSSSSSSSRSSGELTFANDILALTEFGSDPPARECSVAQNTGFFRARGLQLTSDELTEGTYSALHGVYDRSHRIKYDETSTTSDSDLPTYNPLHHVPGNGIRSDSWVVDD